MPLIDGALAGTNKGALLVDRLSATALIGQFYVQVQARSGRRWDTSSPMNLLAKD